MKPAVLALLSATLTFAAEPTPQLSPPLVLHSSGRRIVIPQRNAEGPHDFTQDSCNGYTIETSTLHAAVHSGKMLYLVYSCGGHARGPEARFKRCGAGWEHQINWLAVRGGVVVDHQQRDIESCWRDVSGSVDGWRGSKLFWTSGDLKATYSYFFDSAVPEGGLQIQKDEKLPDQ